MTKDLVEVFERVARLEEQNIAQNVVIADLRISVGLLTTAVTDLNTMLAKGQGAVWVLAKIIFGVSMLSGLLSWFASVVYGN